MIENTRPLPNDRVVFRAAVWHQASRILLLLAFLLLVGHLLIYVQYAIGLIQFPFDYDQGEGFELVDTILFSQGEWPYRNNEIYPFYASNYPPVFHVILVPFVWLFGKAYWYGRLVGFLGTLITASVIGYAVYREEQHRTIAIMSGLAFLASNVVYHVGPLFRQHMTMVLFETVSVVVLAQASASEDRSRRRRMMIVGLLLLLAAGYTKQLALATCVAVFVFLFIRNPRRSIIWGVIFAVVAGGIFWWINLATGGEWWKNIIAANVNEYYPQQFFDLFWQWFRLHRALVILAGLFILYELYFARLSLYSIWGVFAFINTALAGKWGAGDSYFATAIAATCLLSGLFVARTLRGAWEFPPLQAFASLRRLGAALHTPVLNLAKIGVPALYLVYGLSVVKLPTEGAFFGPLAEVLGLESSYGERYAFYDSAGWTAGYATIGHVPTQADHDHGWRIVDILRASERPAMSEEAGFSLLAGQDVITNPTQLKNLYENGLFDPARLVAAIQTHDFSVIVFRAQFYPPPVLDAVYEAYYPDMIILMNGFNYEIWLPGPPQVERDMLALALENLAPGETITQTFSLPFGATATWLDHALTRHNWQWDAETPSARDMFARIYRQGDDRLWVRLCSQDSRAMLRRVAESDAVGDLGCE